MNILASDSSNWKGFSFEELGKTEISAIPNISYSGNSSNWQEWLSTNQTSKFDGKVTLPNGQIITIEFKYVGTSKVYDSWFETNWVHKQSKWIVTNNPEALSYKQKRILASKGVTVLSLTVAVTILKNLVNEILHPTKYCSILHRISDNQVISSLIPRKLDLSFMKFWLKCKLLKVKFSLKAILSSYLSNGNYIKSSSGKLEVITEDKDGNSKNEDESSSWHNISTPLNSDFEVSSSPKSISHNTAKQFTLVTADGEFTFTGTELSEDNIKALWACEVTTKMPNVKVIIVSKQTLVDLGTDNSVFFTPLVPLNNAYLILVAQDEEQLIANIAYGLQKLYSYSNYLFSTDKAELTNFGKLLEREATTQGIAVPRLVVSNERLYY
jgi:hypothetical protein